MKKLKIFSMVALATCSFLASSCEKASDSVAPLSVKSVTADARPVTFIPSGAIEGNVYEHGAIATGLDGYPNAYLELVKIQGTGNRTTYTFKGMLAEGNFPAGGYATPFKNTFPYDGYIIDCVATLDSNGQMTLKNSISASQY